MPPPISAGDAEHRHRHAVRDTQANQRNDSDGEPIRLGRGADAVPEYHGVDAKSANDLHCLDDGESHDAARTLSGAQARITACVDAISGRAAMTRTRATSSPAASLAKAAAAPSGLP